MINTIRDLITQHGRLPVDVASLADDEDLYAAGLTSFSAVQLMLALEEAFDIEFPERMLNRKTFASIAAIGACVTEIAPSKAAA
jgi:acyl carrier protein